MIFARCPADIEDIVEAYCLKRLDPEIVRAFEDHYLVCPDCARIVGEISDFVQAFRIAGDAAPRTKPENRD